MMSCHDGALMFMGCQFKEAHDIVVTLMRCYDNIIHNNYIIS